MKYFAKMAISLLLIVGLVSVVACNSGNYLNSEEKTTESFDKSDYEFEQSNSEKNNTEQTTVNSTVDDEKNTEKNDGEYSTDEPICPPATSVEFATKTLEELAENIDESSLLSYIASALIEKKLATDETDAFSQAKDIFFNEENMTVEGYSSIEAYVYRNAWYEDNVRVFSGVEHYDFTFYKGECPLCEGKPWGYASWTCGVAIIMPRFDPKRVLTVGDMYYTVEVNDTIIYKSDSTTYNGFDQYAMVIDDHMIFYWKIKNDCEDYEEILAQFVEYCSSIKSIMG